MKKLIKKIFADRLHMVDQQRYDVANAVVSRGVKEYVGLDFDILKSDAIEYMANMRIAPYTYKYAGSRQSPCLYASIYAVMLEGLLGVLNNRTEREREEWANYLNGFQNPNDGLYYDPVLMGPAYEHIGDWNEGWGKHHLMGHVIIALARLGHVPRYPLKYLEKYFDTDYLIQWMHKFDFSTDVWTASNYFMNLYTVLEYVRDYMDIKQADKAIKTMVDWLILKQNPNTGMWHEQSMSGLDHLGKLNVVRAAYHFYPLFLYEGIDVPYRDKIVDTILPLQNRWGGWTIEQGNSGACEDIDAVEPLIRYASARPELLTAIKSAIRRSMVWQLACKNDDKGFSFYIRACQEYGGHQITTSLRDESSMFATWFRMLCLAYEMQYLGMPNSFDIGRYPGYEIKL